MPPISEQRLVHQQLVMPALLGDPIALVAAFGAMQAQEYEPAKWAIGVRTEGTTATSVEKLLADGEILRTHPMRGTHHFVARADMRWLVELMGPLMIARNARRNRELALDEKTLGRAMRVLHRAVEGGRHLTRKDVASVLSRARIACDGQRLAHIIYRAELEAVVCSGKRAGKQITIASFDERVGKARRRSREDSLRELALRYFTTRGPATLEDFRWWCQLPAADARAAVELAKVVAVDGYYGGEVRWRARARPPAALLLPPFDEYTVAYRDRSAAGAAPARVTSFGARTELDHRRHRRWQLGAQAVARWPRRHTRAMADAHAHGTARGRRRDHALRGLPLLSACSIQTQIPRGAAE